jgi:hypothetical protein
VLAVGDSTKLEIIFNTKRYSRQMSKSPRITTNEGPPDKRVTIKCHVMVRPDSTYPVVIEPYKVDLSQFTEKKVDRKEFEIRNVSDQPIDVKLVSTAPYYMEIDLPSTIEPGQVGTGEVVLTDEALDESFEKSFTIQCSDEAQTRYTVPVKRTVRTPPPGISGVKGSKDGGSK